MIASVRSDQPTENTAQSTASGLNNWIQLGAATWPHNCVPAGTELRIAVHNSLARDTITFSVDVGDAHDSVVVAPAASGTLSVRPANAARSSTAQPLARHSLAHSASAD